MAALELKFLGGLEILRDGASVELPPSKKTRALLAYLALNGRPFQREHLCDLLWEIPDDPRGSLRWSLSKLRRLVDDDSRQRIVADRNSVAFDASDVEIDVLALHALAGGGLEHVSLDALEAAAARYRGHFLEGLSLSAFQDFDAWCCAERERALQAQSRVLSALVRRLETEPERALPHAYELVRIAPYDETARATLIRLLVALGRTDQAEQQYRTGARLLQEAGAAPTGALYRALRGEPGARRAAGGAESVEARRASVAEHRASVAERRAAAGAPQPPKAPGGAGDTALIGRDEELERIATALARAVAERRGRLVLVCGEPGIGKSRLLEAAAGLARDAGAFMLEACAFESESIRPFALWIDALHRAAANGTADVFGDVLANVDEANRDRLFRALGELVAERARVQPVVVLFDDLHWGDESSASALHYVARTNRDQPFVGVLATREDELRDNTAVRRMLRELRQAGLLEEIELGPLPEADLRALISTRVPQANGTRLSRECGGNPLLAIELARAEAAGDSGQSLDELVQERLARLDHESGDVLRWAAVLAPRIDEATLARVSGLDWNGIGEALETAARQSMLLPTERGFRFSHDLIARSIYSSISPARRRTMHRRVAELLEQDTALDLAHAADLAHHASQSGDAGLCARAMVSAGRLCLRFFANEEALSLARKGLQWVERLAPAERVCLTLELREILLAAAPVEDWEAAAAEYAALAEQALDHGAMAHARRGYNMASYVLWQHGRWTGAHEETLQAERVARGGSEAENIAGLAEAARCLAMLERDLSQAEALLMEAQALAKRKRMSHCAIPGALGMLRFHQNKLDEAVGLFKEARALAKSAGDRISEFQANEYLAMIELERERFDAAKAYCASLIELGEKIREGSERPFAHALDGLCHYALTDETAPLEAALEDLRSADAKHRMAYTLTRAALLDIERRRHETALDRATEALDCAEALDRATDMMLAHVALALASRAANDEAGFERHAAALARLETAPVALWARERAAALTAPLARPA
ncbi:MAG TPA: AAA family ATPase [Gammaproteobacteria bacterium]